MNHQVKLIELYKLVSDDLYESQEFLEQSYEIPKQILDNIELIARNYSKQKGVYTVLTTLLTHKCLHPQQDIRFHQKEMPNGFSGRSIDTKFITPTLKALGLPSMAESGWLTRSLEQPFPYTMDYQGNIGGQGVKNAFLSILNFIETIVLPDDQSKISELLLVYLLKNVIKISNSETIKFDVLDVNVNRRSEIKINDIIDSLKEHFYFKYTTRGTSKLPVLAIYAIYQLLVIEIGRYKSCTLKPLGSHTASDLTSKSAGDIEVYYTEKPNQLLEVLEIKYEKLIDKHIVAIVQEKIERFHPERYIILSSLEIKKEDETDIHRMINETLNKSQCQIIVNGILPTIKYYLRLVSSLTKFIDHYSALVEKDHEIDFEHKQKWAEILQKMIVFQQISNFN
jgi:DNA (cytosine-5)-methyltransferase 1